MLDEAPKDKMVRKEDKAIKIKPLGKLRSYSFPAYGLTIEAYSLSEAENKLLEIINKK